MEGQHSTPLKSSLSLQYPPSPAKQEQSAQPCSGGGEGRGDSETGPRTLYPTRTLSLIPTPASPTPTSPHFYTTSPDASLSPPSTSPQILRDGQPLPTTNTRTNSTSVLHTTKSPTNSTFGLPSHHATHTPPHHRTSPHSLARHSSVPDASHTSPQRPLRSASPKVIYGGGAKWDSPGTTVTPSKTGNIMNIPAGSGGLGLVIRLQDAPLRPRAGIAGGTHSQTFSI